MQEVKTRNLFGRQYGIQLRAFHQDQTLAACMLETGNIYMCIQFLLCSVTPLCTQKVTQQQEVIITSAAQLPHACTGIHAANCLLIPKAIIFLCLSCEYPHFSQKKQLCGGLQYVFSCMKFFIAKMSGLKCTDDTYCFFLPLIEAIHLFLQQ